MSGGGGSSSDGGNDMQVSGAEAAYSTEKGISTHSDTQVSDKSFSQGGNNDGPSYGYGDGKVDPGFQKANTSPRADTSTVGIAAPDTNYSQSEIEKGYTDEGQILSNVNGKYMTKQQMYNTGIVQTDPNTGQEVMGRNTINPNTGELEKADKSFSEHWSDAPESLKFSPVMRFLYASGKNIGEWSNKRGFKGYNEAGARGKLGNATDYYIDRSGGSDDIKNFVGGGDNERDRMNTIAPEAPYIVSGIAPPSSSPAANWFANLGTTSTNNSSNIGLQYANAKQAVAKTLNNKGALGMLAVSDSPYYDWLKTKNLDRGIL
nr:hypothetical protein [uncultured Mediterranean phage uvMED]BAR18543.1 hypothetical protein [uncultured Mediterranean phage uvMED]